MCVYVYRYNIILSCHKQVGNSATHDVSRPREHYTKQNSHLYKVSKIVKLIESRKYIDCGKDLLVSVNMYGCTMGMKFQLCKVNRFYRSAVLHN